MQNGNADSTSSRKTELTPRFFRSPAGHFFLLGPRGTGKTSWVKALFPKSLRLDLLDPATSRDLSARPERLRERIGGQSLLLGYRLPVFSRRAQRAFAVHPKFFYFDAGVFRANRPTGPLDAPSDIDGAALEGLVAQRLRAWCDYTDGEHQLHYWQTRSQNEVNFVVYGPLGLHGIEVKNSAQVRPEDLRGLRSFGEDYPEASRWLLYRGSERSRRDGVLCVPVEEFLRQLHPGSFPN